jgi:hypothetical protein
LPPTNRGAVAQAWRMTSKTVAINVDTVTINVPDGIFMGIRFDSMPARLQAQN